MKRYTTYCIFSITLSLVLLSSCYYNSEEYLYGKPGDSNCPDSTIITYSGGVQPILSKYCYTCHSNSNASSMGSGVKLQDYADVKARASNGSLLGTITHSSGYPPMPQGGRKLEDCNILIIRKWVEAGSLNN